MNLHNWMYRPNLGERGVYQKLYSCNMYLKKASIPDAQQSKFPIIFSTVLPCPFVLKICFRENNKHKAY